MSKKSRARENEAITSLIETSLKQINEQFDEIEKITDVAEKILKLQKLELDIRRASSNVASKKSNIAYHRTMENPWAFVTVWQKGAEKKLLEQNPGLGDFSDTMKAYRDRVSEMLDKTIENCDIDHPEEVYNSPYFVKALKNCEQLQDFFNAAIVKRAASGESPVKEPTIGPQLRIRRNPNL